MKITALQEYGMRCLLQLGASRTELPQTTTSIAEKEGLSRDYVEKILFQLRKAHVVRSVRGINGGYILAKNPHEISVGEVLMVLSERPIRTDHVKDDLCKQYPGKKLKCVHFSSCTIRLYCLQRRSEEHTSELHHQIISYAVFCLKKKKHE